MGGICFIMYMWLDEIVWYLFRVNIPSTKLSNKHAKNKTPITNDVIPVLPPALTPAPDST